MRFSRFWGRRSPISQDKPRRPVKPDLSSLSFGLSENGRNEPFPVAQVKSTNSAMAVLSEALSPRPALFCPEIHGWLSLKYNLQHLFRLPV